MNKELKLVLKAQRSFYPIFEEKLAILEREHVKLGQSIASLTQKVDMLLLIFQAVQNVIQVQQQRQQQQQQRDVQEIVWEEQKDFDEELLDLAEADDDEEDENQEEEDA